MSENRSAIEYIRMVFKMTHDYLEGTMIGVTDDVARYEPGGPPSILGQYAHIVTSEDWLVNIKVGNGTPVMATMDPGFNAPPPPTGWDGWARTATVNLDKLRQYAQKVYAATDAYLATVDDSILGKPVDMSDVGLGMLNAAACFALATGNNAGHTGEISTIKGLQGLVGYPTVDVAETATGGI